MPPITRAYVTAAFFVTALCSLELVSPFSLYFSLKLVVFKLEVWRVITNFLFFGALGIDFLFHMFFLARCTLHCPLMLHCPCSASTQAWHVFRRLSAAGGGFISRPRR